MKNSSAFLRMNRPGARLAVTVTEPAGAAGLAGIHYHSAFELHMVEEGGLTVCALGREYAVRAGECCIVGPGVYHYLRDAGAARCELRAEADVAPGEHGLYTPLLRPHVLVYRDSASAGLLRRALDELRERGPCWREAVEACIDLVLVSAARATGAATAVAQDERPLPADMRERIVSDFFSDNFAAPLRPDDLARQLSVSVRQLDRLLKHSAGLSFKRMLIKTRMEAAKDMLARTSLPIERVAEAVGYGAQSNFYRMFKEYEGVTPAIYRESRRLT